MKTAVSGISFFKGLDVTNNDPPGNTLHNHVLFGLAKENLINQFSYKDGHNVFKDRYDYVDDSLIFVPTVLGINLYLWAHGRGMESPEYIVDEDTELRSSADIEIHPPVRSYAIEEASI